MENANLTFGECLRAHVGRLLRALDAQDTPKTYGDILKAARAIIAVKKAIDLVFKAIKDVDLDLALPPRTDLAVAADEPAPALNRQMRRMLDAKTRKRGS